MGFAFRPQIWRGLSSVKGGRVISVFVFRCVMYMMCGFGRLMGFFYVCRLCAKGFHVLFFCR